MKKLFFLAVIFSVILSACLPAALQPQATSPAPVSVENLEATAAIISQQTLQALPTQTLVPSVTPVIMTPSETATLATPTETQNPILLTLTATLGTGTVTVDGTSGTPVTSIPGGLPFTTTPGSTLNPAIGIVTGTPHPQHYGTMPPNLPYGRVILVNKSKAEVYVSLQCTTKEGYVTIIEYPVKSTIETKAPAGKYVYVIWVGGKQLIGDFSLSQAQDLKITIFKDRAVLKQ